MLCQTFPQRQLIVTDEYALGWVIQCKFDPDQAVTYNHHSVKLAGADEVCLCQSLIFFLSWQGDSR